MVGVSATPHPGLTLVLDQGLHLLAQAVVPARHVEVQRVVAAGLPVGAAAPLLVGAQQTGTGVCAHVLNWGQTDRRVSGGDRSTRGAAASAPLPALPLGTEAA